MVQCCSQVNLLQCMVLLEDPLTTQQCVVFIVRKDDNIRGHNKKKLEQEP